MGYFFDGWENRFIKYAIMTQHALPCPFTECINILSPFLIVFVMKL